MNLIKESNDYFCLQVSKEELSIITGTLIEFDQEMHWALNRSTNKDLFKENFNKKFAFSLEDLKYISEALSEMEFNIRKTNITEIDIALFTARPKKPTIMYTALNECSKNYEDYEISIRQAFTQQELDTVLKEFKEKVIEEMQKTKTE